MNPSGNGRAFVYQHHGMVAGLGVPWVGSWGPVPEDKGTRQREQGGQYDGAKKFRGPFCSDKLMKQTFKNNNNNKKNKKERAARIKSQKENGARY